jgi:hypothetical protein
MDILRETALVGTEKKPLDISVLPEAVKQQLMAGEPEQQFLQAATLLNFYRLAGTYPAAYKGTVDDAIVTEDKPVASDDLLALYSKLEMVDHQLRDAVLNLWLDAIIDQGAIVSPAILVSLIRNGRNAPQVTKGKIAHAVGNKGSWILRVDRSVSYPEVSLGEETWTEGTTQERKAMFIHLHAQRPADGIDLLRSTWRTESVVTKKVFLELLSQNFTPADLAFAEDCYYQEFQYQPKEKKTERECRRLLAGMLLSLASSSLHAKASEKLDQYFTRGKKGILGFVTGKETVSFKLPDSDDQFWNANVMDEMFGLESKGFDIALFGTPQLYWLSCLLERLPMKFWAKYFDGDYNRCVDYWLGNDAYKATLNGESVSIFTSAMIENALAHRDADLASVLATRMNSREVIPLLRILEPKTFEEFIRKNKYWEDAELLSNGPFTSTHSWSFEFSNQVIEQAYDQAMRNNTSVMIGKAIAQYAHADSTEALYRFNEKARESPQYNVWNTAVFQVANATMEIRNKINAIKK